MTEIAERLKDLSWKYLKMRSWLEGGTLLKEDAKQFRVALKDIEVIIRDVTEDKETDMKELARKIYRGELTHSE